MIDTADLCERVRAHVAGVLADAGRPVGASYVAAGEVAFDDCCPGILAVMPERTHPTQTFGEDIAVVTNAWGEACAGDMEAVTVVVVLVRCVPTLDSYGRAPSPQELHDANLAVLRDADVVRSSLSIEGLVTRVVDQSYLAPSGGCIAVETRAEVQPDDDWMG